MKKIIFTAAFVAAGFTSFAQVGIGTTTPQGALDVASANSGVIVPRVATIDPVTTPVNGMIIYDIANKCVRAYEDNKWSDCLSGKATITIPVVSPTGKTWMDRNLGATQVATSSADAASYGDLYQWGRLTDGHQIRTSTASVLNATVSTDVPGNANFIVTNAGNYDWRAPQNNNLWQGVNGVNNPCPSGYRLPSETELNAERLIFTQNNAAGAFASVLKLPMAGFRNASDGSLLSVGSRGLFWSSLVGGNTARSLDFNSSNAFINSSNRADGFSVRCLKD
jgi:uncharacterized protein (TIGR02145 family)